MQRLAFDSVSLGATEEFLNSAYTKMNIGNAGTSRARARVYRDYVGPVSLDRLDLGFEMRYDADPLGKVCLCTVEAGTIEENYHDADTDVFLPGEAGLLTPPDLPYSGVIHTARYGITMFDPGLLTRVAANAPGADDTPVRLTGHRPVSAAAGRQLFGVVTHLQALSRSEEEPHLLVHAAAADYLAATVLSTLPNTAVLEPTAADRHDAHPDTVRRALAYMESHLREDIAVTDIAGASYVTVRALQLAFRRHLDTTPMGHLRELRLRAAHEQLKRSSPDDGHTVTAVAATWGFGHPGRFAAAYRTRYGRSPQTTLHS